MLKMIKSLVLSRDKGKTTCRMCGKVWDLDMLDPKFSAEQKKHFEESPKCVVVRKVLTK